MSWVSKNDQSVTMLRVTPVGKGFRLALEQPVTVTEELAHLEHQLLTHAGSTIDTNWQLKMELFKDGEAVPIVDFYEQWRRNFWFPLHECNSSFCLMTRSNIRIREVLSLGLARTIHQEDHQRVVSFGCGGNWFEVELLARGWQTPPSSIQQLIMIDQKQGLSTFLKTQELWTPQDCAERPLHFITLCQWIVLLQYAQMKQQSLEVFWFETDTDFLDTPLPFDIIYAVDVFDEFIEFAVKGFYKIAFSQPCQAVLLCHHWGWYFHHFVNSIAQPLTDEHCTLDGLCAMQRQDVVEHMNPQNTSTLVSGFKLFDFFLTLMLPRRWRRVITWIPRILVVGGLVWVLKRWGR